MEEEDEVEILKKRIFGKKKIWESSNLGVYADGGWFTFIDKSNNKRLNSPRLKNLSYKVSYKPTRKYEKPQENDVDPFDIVKEHNYSRFPSRKLFRNIESSYKPKTREIRCELPNLQAKTKTFKGGTPIVMPLKLSNLLLNEKREKERKEIYSPGNRINSPLNEAKTERSSYRKSIKRNDH